MKELWPLEENKYIFLFYGETVPEFRQNQESMIKLPVKWLAPESINDGIFSEKTDVVRTCSSMFRGVFSTSCTCKLATQFVVLTRSLRCSSCLTPGPWLGTGVAL